MFSFATRVKKYKPKNASRVLTAAKGFAVLNPWGEMRCPDSTVVREQACAWNHSRGVELCNRAKETRGNQVSNQMQRDAAEHHGVQAVPLGGASPACGTSASCWFVSRGLVSLSHLTPPGSRPAPKESRRPLRGVFL